MEKSFKRCLPALANADGLVGHRFQRNEFVASKYSVASDQHPAITIQNTIGNRITRKAGKLVLDQKKSINCYPIGFCSTNLET